MIKYFRFDYEYVLWGISFQNLNMLLATIPVYDSDKKDKKEDEVIMIDGGVAGLQELKLLKP